MHCKKERDLSIANIFCFCLGTNGLTRIWLVRFARIALKLVNIYIFFFDIADVLFAMIIKYVLIKMINRMAVMCIF